MRALDQREGDPTADDLIDAVWDTLDFIEANPSAADARRRALRTPAGQTVWLVRVPNRHRHEPWVVLWQARGDEGLIAYIGPDDFRPGGK
jgi:hypothetical protein